MTSNRDIEKLFDKWNPHDIRAGDRVKVTLMSDSYIARVVGLDLDIKNQKVYANLRLMDNTQKRPCRVDVSDCKVVLDPIYPGHHSNVW